MTVDQSLTPVALDRGEASSQFGFLSAEDIDEALANEGLDGEPADEAGSVSGSLMPPPAFSAWPRVYPGL